MRIASVLGLVLALGAAGGGEAMARPITYMVDCTVSGQIGNRGFTDRRLNVIAVADTGDISPAPGAPGGVVVPVVSAAAYVGGIGYVVRSDVRLRQSGGSPTVISVVFRDASGTRTFTLTSPDLADAELDERIDGVSAFLGGSGPVIIPLLREGQTRNLILTAVQGNQCRFRSIVEPAT